MTSSRKIPAVAALAVFQMISSAERPALAWGERGHHAICEAATRLVREPALAAFLQTRGDTMGHVCNIPDIYWRDLGAIAKAGDDTHFLDPENAGITADQVPTDLAAYLSMIKEPADADHRASVLGTMWWRAEQF